MQIKSSGCISADHPALAGHFPGRPVVPGVLLLREVLAAIENQWGLAPGPVSWTAVKFSASLRPDEPFAMWVQMNGGQRILFTITRGDTTIASGSLQHHGSPVASVGP
jgi:3-hydroxymyristoyl/3-hydroxydecanoyl-(acyl carrier protein) dehydratase